MYVVVDKKAWEEIRRQAVKSFPNECVGFYIGYMHEMNKMDILEVRPCKNISQDKRIGSMVSRREMKKIAKECERLNKKVRGFFIGQYHSHPTTGSIIQSALDQAAGRRWKEYRHQLIIGLRSKSVKSIRKMFHIYDRKNRVWQAEKIVVKD
jgi:proteasome lid subunit RPN8/RPN11